VFDESVSRPSTIGQIERISPRHFEAIQRTICRWMGSLTPDL